MAGSALGTNDNDYPVLDSSFFVAFELAHDALLRGIREASALNITQYEVLVKLLLVAPDTIAQKELGRLVGVGANVITQAIDGLEAKGFAERHRSALDRRSRFVRATEAAEQHAATVNSSIVKQLYALFPTQQATYRRILEASIIAGADIDPPHSKEVAKRYQASRTLVSLERVRKATKACFKTTVQAGYNECRVLQRLGEVAEPLRIIDLSRQLLMRAVDVTRAVDALVELGWAERLSSPKDRKAVFVRTTVLGEERQHDIAAAISSMACDYLWARLPARHREAISQVGQVVIADLQARQEAERLSELSRLQPHS